MKPFQFFLTRIFLRKPLLVVVTLVLLFMSNYITFTTTRTIFSTLEGYQEVSHFSSPKIFIGNLDPSSDASFNNVSDTSIQKVYDHLNERYSYGVFTDGYIVNLHNTRNVELPFAYMNRKYAELNGFNVATGSNLNFNYHLGRGDVIPVLVGKGISNDYPIGSKFTIADPALNRKVTYKVVGILAENPSHSNLYALDSKQYYNFSVVVPINSSFIRRADKAFKFNALMDIVVANVQRSDVTDLANYIRHMIGTKFNFFSQQENIRFYNKYFRSAMIFLVIISVLLLVGILILATWASLAGVRVMIRDFTINLLVGLSYKKFRRYLCAYYVLLAGISLAVILLLTAYWRFSNWQRNDALFMTYGFGGGLIFMDWMGLAVAVLIDIVLVSMIVMVVTRRLRRVPISVGVLQ